MNAAQEHYASNEGLTRIYMDHAVTIDGGNMHHKVFFAHVGSLDRGRRVYTDHLASDFSLRAAPIVIEFSTD